MLNTLLAALTIPSAAPIALQAKPVSVSLFKNGFAVVVREAKLGASGEYALEQLPVAVLGTLWITASPGVKLREVVVGNVEHTIDRPLASIEEVLAANVGKRLTFRLSDRRVEVGTLRSVQNTLCIIERELAGKTSVWALPKASVIEVESDGDLVYSVKGKVLRRTMRMQAETPGTGTLSLVTLERGASWAPGYAIDISDPKTLRLTAKATLLNDTLDFDGIEARLVTGFPNIPFVRWMDPFTSGQSLQDFVNSLMSMGTPSDLRRDAGFAAPGAATQGRMAERRFDEAFETSNLPGVSSEDLFFYRQPNVRLKPGDRGYYILFSATAEYRHVYELELPDTIQDTRYIGSDPGQPKDVWHSLKFKNTAKQPLTTAVASVMNDGEILGQDMMSYTSPEAEATVKITKALDVRADDDEEELSREREFLKIRSGHYDKVILKGTIQLANRKIDPVQLQIEKVLTGEVQQADAEPKITNLAKGLRAVNTRQRLLWNLELKPGERKTITYTYTVFIAP